MSWTSSPEASTDLGGAVKAVPLQVAFKQQCETALASLVDDGYANADWFLCFQATSGPADATTAKTAKHWGRG